MGRANLEEPVNVGKAEQLEEPEKAEDFEALLITVAKAFGVVPRDDP